MRKLLIMGNWKMNGSLQSITALLQGLQAGLKSSAVEYAVFPPAVYVPMVAATLKGSAIAVGGQEVSAQASGAFTGEISAAMWQEMGCRYVLIGHSERRQYHGETDANVAAKCKAALAAGLRAVVCIGETLAEREAQQTEAVVAKQLAAVLQVLDLSKAEGLVIAYEPVWAIGTGKTATAAQVEAVHAFLRGECAKRSKTLAEKVQIVYGGSLKAANAPELLALPNVDGGLIGGASLIAEEFVAIGRTAEQCSK